MTCRLSDNSAGSSRLPKCPTREGTTGATVPPVRLIIALAPDHSLSRTHSCGRGFGEAFSTLATNSPWNSVPGQCHERFPTGQENVSGKEKCFPSRLFQCLSKRLLLCPIVAYGNGETDPEISQGPHKYRKSPTTQTFVTDI